jgi:hypothetical protein
MLDILKNFETKYAPLKKKGLKINGMQMVDPKKKTHIINISKPFLFDNRQLPKKYEGIAIKSKIEGNLPEEFSVDRSSPDWAKVNYIWAPERFEKYVDRCPDEIKKAFGNPDMDRKEMLDAICFGNFEEHKQKSVQMIKEGKIPAYRGN